MLKKAHYIIISMRFYEDPRAKALLDACKTLEAQSEPVTANNVYNLVKNIGISHKEAQESAEKWQNGKRIPWNRRE
jgi:hypothetical protein